MKKEKELIVLQKVTIGSNDELHMVQETLQRENKAMLIQLFKSQKNERDILIDLLDYYKKLKPSQKVSVWSKNGEHAGIFDMDSEQIVDRYLDKLKP